MRGWWYLFVMVLLVISCTKDEVVQMDAAVSTVLPGQWLSGLDFNSQGIGLTCGGIPNEHGRVLRTTDNGKTWQVVLSHSTKCFYFVRFVNDTLVYAGGDYVELWRSTDAGINWQVVDLGSNVPTNEFDRPAFRDMACMGYRLVMVGGDYAKKGVCYVCNDFGYTWYFTQMDHQIAGVALNAIGSAFIAGWGYAATIGPFSAEPVQLDLRGDFYTSVVFSDENTVWMTGYSGTIYRSDDLGASWIKAFHSGQCKFNSIASVNGVLYATSDNGLIARCKLTDRSWSLLQLPVKERILRLSPNHIGGLTATTSEGKFISG
ncbi:MAG: hypothetical protein CVU06_12635, partial [Bacteroidetes bacterium HGW-Bacteroidetes-22]